ncbi:Helix-turn-helix type 3 domain protein [Candidatus Magnetomorum sp. HK-1]|nr:Helix-turn-helix type 3 domain protein [Candidatus Magnetomorum sp. HK-1]
MNLQQRIKFIQTNLGITQKDFAKGLKVPPGSVTDWFYKGVTPRADKLLLMVETYSVNPDFLLRGCGAPFLTKHEWTERDEARFKDRYPQLLFLINHYQHRDLINGFYKTLEIKNWREALDQKLGNLIFGTLYSNAKRFNISPNFLLVETYSAIFFDIMKCLAQGKDLREDHLYILSEVCGYQKEDFIKIIPDNPLSESTKEELYTHIEYEKRIKYKIYGLKSFSKSKSSTMNTAWTGIKEAFKQLDDVFRYQEIPNFCEVNQHNYFYWTKCPICENKTELTKAKYEQSFINIDMNDDIDSCEELVDRVCDELEIKNISMKEFMQRIKSKCGK